ncbi:hypothetical protein T4D_6086 [Trichinella pseudospiralis]|uniref:Uncharacterized protein n=1 Tax=Trichinella pseudospiralis TaxID=6337 RepID=A0A0V1F7A6_TRIPS|nr:hypothetical protein T4D_6086 [Trichinella pseudospiralis]
MNITYLAIKGNSKSNFDNMLLSVFLLPLCFLGILLNTLLLAMLHQIHRPRKANLLFIAGDCIIKIVYATCINKIASEAILFVMILFELLKTVLS